MEEKSLLQTKWENNQLPGINCLAFASGDVLVFHYFQPNSSKIENCIYLFCDTTIESLYKYNSDTFTEIELNLSAQKEYKGNNLICGAGSMGNEGFVALRTKANKLLWAYFFNFSNPIWSLEIIDEHVRCFSETKMEILINLTIPSITKIIEHPFNLNQGL